jgi:hypothetical protein
MTMARARARGGQQGQAAPDQHPAEPAARLTAGQRCVKLYGDLLSWTVLRHWQRLLVRAASSSPVAARW